MKTLLLLVCLVAATFATELSASSEEKSSIQIVPDEPSADATLLTPGRTYRSSVSRLTFQYYYLNFTANSTPTIELSVRTGTAFLYVGLGFFPTLDSNSWSDTSASSEKTFRLCSPTTQVVAYAGVYGYTDSTFDITGDNGNYILTENKIVNETVINSCYNYYRVDIPAGVFTVQFPIVATGSRTLYQFIGSGYYPTSAKYNYYGTTSSCIVISKPAAGTYFYGVSAQSSTAVSYATEYNLNSATDCKLDIQY